MIDDNVAPRGKALDGRGVVWPLTGPISQGFGCTSLALEPREPSCPGGHFHSGIDIAAGCGAPIRAAAAGSMAVHVTTGGYGDYVTIDDGTGWLTLYGHLADFYRGAGRVEAGELIGHEGSTGNSTGCHLHFEVRHDAVAVDPRPLLP